MQTIGERLEEARKRKGISLREAAEATKIRSDFLSSIEQNKFDFELPEIYKNGFIKNYARYLRLDPEKVLTDYHAQQLSHTRLGRKNGAELFGTMDLKKSPAGTAEPEAAGGNGERSSTPGASMGRISSTPSPAKVDENDEAEDQAGSDEESDKIFYIKAGLIFVGTLAFVIVVFGLIKAILGGGDDAVPADNGTDSAITSSVDIPVEPPSLPATTSSLKLIANGTVYVMVKQKQDNQVIYKGTLSSGDEIPLTKTGPVDVMFTAGENLVIEQNGERMRPGASGTAKITLD
ncbi:helix-turn-helix domain-containing protein [Coraliomargarita parva]|uniref:helix-turn-helix domain-containing protein n=1 Tax=Coraliomargarita parva TaxID=3014050 RepID=UPI0022B2CA30|nr:helix-turn-helix domain-containing protein [Coraliomargarita parva]